MRGRFFVDNSEKDSMKSKWLQQMLVILWVCISACAFAEESPLEVDVDPPRGNGIQLGDGAVHEWKVGVEVTASRGTIVGAVATIPIPTNWPEQTVERIEEESSRNITSVKYRKLGGGVEQMVVTIRRLRANETAYAYALVRVHRKAIIGPQDTAQFEIPQKLDRSMRKFISPSPYIESNHRKIRKLAKEIVAEIPPANDWKKVEAIYDWVREQVQYEFDKEIKGALQSLDDGHGDCEELTSLFVALCRANRIPARAIWIPNHCYPEFYMEDQDGYGHWFPCQAAGSRAFGSMPEHRPILQKGDNFKVPDKKKPQRYVAEFFKAQIPSGSGNPTVRWERQLITPVENEPAGRARDLPFDFKP